MERQPQSAAAGRAQSDRPPLACRPSPPRGGRLRARPLSPTHDSTAISTRVPTLAPSPILHCPHRPRDQARPQPMETTMTTLDRTTRETGRAGLSLSGLVGRALSLAYRAMKMRSERAALQAMPDFVLKDIGISRSQIEYSVRYRQFDTDE
ncbi:DUF1127 domain-containing protein [Mesorhizobium sp. M1E.F.Ca.ET.045.02.1.1]|nr:DUF1127 domain-containing protein [Mesorhizobium sp. M1E.F.Ca.ET.045.02.1.1]RUW29437.1 DUF1127 domain-containing protein [Mesorhizobium sp. M1E.F.Ca.ET.041.01.1.1]RUW78348.1 DUF1127 domain-containing protein [Mesorhizobium sp. M1E.F.Ca.ET.063.01.1.1]RWD88831.1 MAG: DUF1127 domain-containing protein [Mesorhizobium sp.]